MHKRFGSSLLSVGLLLATGLMLGSCDKGVVDPKGNQETAPINFTAYALGTPVNTIVIEVTADDIKNRLVFNLEFNEDFVASGIIQVPVGEERLFTVTTFDDQHNLTHEGAAVTDVSPGHNPPLKVNLKPVTGDVDITVTLGDYAVIVAPSAATIDASGGGTTVQLAVTVLNQYGEEVVDPPVQWATTHPTLANVSTDGLVTGLADGEAMIVATYGGVAGMSEVTLTGFDGGPSLPPDSYEPNDDWSVSTSIGMTAEDEVVAIGGLTGHSSADTDWFHLQFMEGDFTNCFGEETYRVDLDWSGGASLGRLLWDLEEVTPDHQTPTLASFQIPGQCGGWDQFNFNFELFPNETAYGFTVQVTNITEYCDGIDNDGDGEVDEGCSPLNWAEMDSGVTEFLFGVWGAAEDDVFAVGNIGTILHYDGSVWTQQTSPTTNILNAVWGSSSSDVFAVGDNGTIIHYDGSVWTEEPSPTSAHFKAVWGRSSNDVFAADFSGGIYHFDGSAWTLSGSTGEALYSIWGTPTDAWAVSWDWVSEEGQLFRYTGSSWQPLPTPDAHVYDLWGYEDAYWPFELFLVGQDWAGNTACYRGPPGSWTTDNCSVAGEGYLRSVWGSSAWDVYAAGSGGTILHWNGLAWTQLTSGTTITLFDVWGSSAENAFIVGGGGIILHGTR